MSPAEFDKFADEYRLTHARNIAITGEAPEYFAEYKMKDLAAEYVAHSQDADHCPSVLDFGAGIGTSVPFLRKHLPRARITCVDVSTRSLEIGKSLYGEDVAFLAFDGSRLPFPDASFDIAYAACVFHHIDHAQHIDLLTELRRVLRPGGLLAVFEHNPYNPLTVRAVQDCPFDENAQLIPASAMRERLLQAGLATTYIRYRIFFPRLLSILRPIESRLTWLPLGAQYYAIGIK
jgi:SAM-dependent methyltransferase